MDFFIIIPQHNILAQTKPCGCFSLDIFLHRSDPARFFNAASPVGHLVATVDGFTRLHRCQASDVEIVLQ